MGQYNIEDDPTCDIFTVYIGNQHLLQTWPLCFILDISYFSLDTLNFQIDVERSLARLDPQKMSYELNKCDANPEQPGYLSSPLFLNLYHFFLHPGCLLNMLHSCVRACSLMSKPLKIYLKQNCFVTWKGYTKFNCM